MKTRRFFPELNRQLILSTVLIVLFSLGFQAHNPSPSQLPSDRHQPYNFVGKSGMVVAAHPLAAQAGRKTLMDGGNAVDAAVATAFVLNAAEPFASGIGGGGFMVIYLAASKKVTVINYREKAPSRAFPEMFYEEGKLRRDWKRNHGLAVAVPGALAGWSYALKKYGTQSLNEVVREAIAIAEKGLEISTTFSMINKDEYEKLILNDGEDSRYLNQGLPYEPGDILKNPDLVQTFRTLVTKGIDEFYKGDIAERIVKAVQDKGGLITLEDLARYKPLEQEPLVGGYKDYTLYTISPPSSGGLHIIQLLNIMENWPLKEWGLNTPRYIHHFGEALRFVFADRARYLGDPEFVDIPVHDLISEVYASSVASKIQPDRLQASYPPSSFDKGKTKK